MIVRLVSVATVLIGAAVVLVGCTPASNLAVRLEGGVLSIATCDAVDAEDVGVWSKEGGDDFQTMWSASGSHSFQAGDVLQYGEAPPGMVDDIDPRPLPEDGRLGVHVVGEPGSLNGAFDVVDLADGKWHAADGSIRTESCS